MKIHQASTLIQEAAHEDANIIFGSVIDETMNDELKVTVIATGFETVDSKMRDIVPKLAVKKETQDIPTIIRNRWEENKFAQVKTPESAIPVEQEYDVPAFLRKRL